MDGCASVASNYVRKEKRQLTFIPEQATRIDFRFSFVLIGRRAKEIANSICTSEMAENYLPAASNPNARCSVVGVDNVTLQENALQDMIASLSSSQESAELPNSSASGDNLRSSGESTGSSKLPTPSPSGGSARLNRNDSAGKPNDFRCFCPLPSAPKEQRNSLQSERSDVDGEAKGGTTRLCRILFSMVEEFTDSLPMVQDAISARNTAFIFLTDCKGDDVSGQLRDHNMRFMELKRMSGRIQKFALLIRRAGGSKEDEVGKWVSTKKLDGERLFEMDGSDDCELFEAMQQISVHLSDKMTDRSGSKTSTYSTDSLDILEEQPKKEKKRCWPCRFFGAK